MAVSLAVLRDAPADPIRNAQARPMIGIQQFMLHGINSIVAFPVFLKRNNGRIQRFIMLKAMIPNTTTDQPQRLLQDVWLLIPGNPRVSQNDNTKEYYFADQSEGMVFSYMASLATKPMFNSLTATVTLRNMPIVPNRKYGSAPNHFLTKNLVELTNQHTELCGGKRGDVMVEPMLPNSEEFSNFMARGYEQTEKFFASLVGHGMFEPNLVFEVLPGTISMGTMPFYNSALGDALLSSEIKGIRRLHAISNWNGAAKMNMNVQKVATGNNQHLSLGIRETGNKYAFDRLCTVFDRRMNSCDGRLSLIDPVTKSYLEGIQRQNPEGEEEGVDTNIPVSNRKSRAKTLEEAAKQMGFIQFFNAELKAYTNGENPDSMAVTFELALHEHSTYTGIRDTSKLGNVAQVDMSEDVDLLMAGFNEADLENILNATTGLKIVDESKPAEEAPATPAHAGGVGTGMDEDLPF